MIRKIFYKNKIKVMSSAYISKDSVIGDYTYIGFNTFITKTVIGRYCSIANNVSIGHGEHSIEEIATSSLFYLNAYETLTKNDCKIGNDVWIGVGATIRRGVTIGDGAIIGANSFVNKDVKSFSVVGGVPAKFLKMRFSEKQIEIIHYSKWWLHDKTEARLIIEELKTKVNNL